MRDKFYWIKTKKVDWVLQKMDESNIHIINDPEHFNCEVQECELHQEEAREEFLTKRKLVKAIGIKNPNPEQIKHHLLQINKKTKSMTVPISRVGCIRQGENVKHNIDHIKKLSQEGE